MTAAEIFEFVKNGGGYCSPLLLIALIWMERDRSDLLRKLEDKSAKVDSLSERTITVLTELKGMFGHGRARQ